jgi:hypothetical protein
VDFSLVDKLSVVNGSKRQALELGADRLVIIRRSLWEALYERLDQKACLKSSLCLELGPAAIDKETIEKQDRKK